MPAAIAVRETSAERSITVRVPDLPLDTTLPVDWYGGRPGVTCFLSALGALFPEGERFFVRSVSAYRNDIDDPALCRDVAKFIGQEVQHGGMHDRYNAVLCAQGISLDGFFRVFRRICRSPAPRFLRPLMLSITVAVEHFTSVSARLALELESLSPAHPALRQLFEWHALEELEHKAVAFDVLRYVSGSYIVRMAGFLLCAIHAWLFLAVPLLWILARRRLVFSPRVWWDLACWAFLRERMLLRFVKGVLPYFNPRFHPDQHDDRDLIARFAPRVA